MSRLSHAGALRAVSGLRQRPRQLLAGALFTSLLVHLLCGAWLQGPSPVPAPLPVLAATLTRIPPPPVPPVRHATPRHKPKVARPTAPAAMAAIAAAEAVGVAAAGAPDTTPAEPLREAAPAPEPTEEALPIAAPDPASPQPLPPRIELVYRGFLGTQGFFVGDAVYLFEHTANQYRVTTVGEARGLAALFLHGQGRLTSTGTITPAGLQPNLYTAERTVDGRREAATFDWENGVVLLNDNKTAGLELPTFDPLVVLWQFYFSPPEQDDAEFNVATTRRVYRNRFHRVGLETVTLSFGDFGAEVWERNGGDGSVSARVWLAPSLHHVMVKLRISNGRITAEALLDSIRVDETVAQQ